MSLIDGMNKFLQIMGITFRRDPTNFRPRINKMDSQLDKEQKSNGNYFCTDDWSKYIISDYFNIKWNIYMSIK